MSVKSVITGNNCDVIAAAAELWMHPTDQVIDLTYGRGKFWTVYEPLKLTKGDIDPTKGDGHDFCNRPEPDASYDVVVFDPPYISQGGRESSTIGDMQERYGLYNAPTTPAAVDTLISDGIWEAERLLRTGGILLVKCMDYISSGKFHQGHYTTVESAHNAGLVQVDEIIHHGGTGPQPSVNLDGSPRRQVHSRRAHSFLCMFQKPRRKA